MHLAPHLLHDYDTASPIFAPSTVHVFRPFSIFCCRFERASIDIIKIEIEDIGSPTKVRIGHDGKGSRPAWYLERVSWFFVKGPRKSEKCLLWYRIIKCPDLASAVIFLCLVPFSSYKRFKSDATAKARKNENTKACLVTSQSKSQ